MEEENWCYCEKVHNNINHEGHKGMHEGLKELLLRTQRKARRTQRKARRTQRITTKDSKESTKDSKNYHLGLKELPLRIIRITPGRTKILIIAFVVKKPRFSVLQSAYLLIELL